MGQVLHGCPQRQRQSVAPYKGAKRGIVTLISRGRHEAEGRRCVDLHAY
jgi:hypothetical protein